MTTQIYSVTAMGTLTMLLGILLLLSLITIVVMFVSLAKQGDERRKTIIEKASTKTFAITLIYLVIRVVIYLIEVWMEIDISPDGMNPLVMLSVVSVIYAAFLIHYKKKYGN